MRGRRARAATFDAVGRMIASIAAEVEAGFLMEPELAYESHATAIATRAARIRDEPIAHDLHGHFGLDHFDRLVGDVGGRIGDALDSVAICTGAPRADEHFVEDELTALESAAGGHQERSSLRAADGTFGNDLRERLHDRVEHTVADNSARTARGREQRIEKASFRRPHRDRPQIAV